MTIGMAFVLIKLKHRAVVVFSYHNQSIDFVLHQNSCAFKFLAQVILRACQKQCVTELVETVLHGLDSAGKNRNAKVGTIAPTARDLCDAKARAAAFGI